MNSGNTKGERKIFYTNNSLKYLKLKPDPQHRLFKFQLQNFSWVILKEQIRNEKDLLKQLIRFQPLNVFSSVSTWLNPLNIENPKAESDRIMLDSLLYIDIDSHKKSILKKVRNRMRQLKIAEEWNYGNSGEGFFDYYNLNLVPIQNPKIRYIYYQGIKKQIINELKDVDVPVSVDMERISRVIGTYNEGESLCHSLKGRLKSFKGKKKEKKEVEKRVPELYYSYKFITNVVEGTNNLCIPILKFKGKVPDLKGIQRKFNLSTFFLFETHNSKIAICLKIVDKNRLKNIMKFAKCESNAFEKYGFIWIRTSKLITNQGLKDDKPRLKKIIIEKKFDNEVHSRPHLDLLKHLGIKVEYPNLVGKKSNKVYVAKFKGF